MNSLFPCNELCKSLKGSQRGWVGAPLAEDMSSACEDLVYILLYKVEKKTVKKEREERKEALWLPQDQKFW